ncbi:MAG: hypothetical protein OXC40_04940, partial [Proteobacteria bacterium]|nr:hypothetical protein [Pseudomonadota bacterium]
PTLSGDALQYLVDLHLGVIARDEGVAAPEVIRTGMGGFGNDDNPAVAFAHQMANALGSIHSE